MDIETNRAEFAGLKVSCLDLVGSVPLGDPDDIRLLIPLTTHETVHTYHPAGGANTVVPWPAVSVVPPRMPCEISSESLTRVAVLAVDAALCEREALAATGVPAHVVDPSVRVDPLLRRLGNVFAAGLRVRVQPDPTYLEGAARELALHIALNYGRPAKRAGGRGLAPDRLGRTIQLIEESLGSSLHVSDLAGHVHMSPFHFARMFKLSTGQSPHFYITTRRVDRAKELLEHSPLTLAEIAQAVGFATQAHFTGVFRSYAGTTPRVYRLRSREPASHPQ